MFTRFEERTLLAQGELISTQMMQFYLEEKGVRSALLPALDFMRIDQQGEPDMWYVKSNLERMIKEHADVDLFITQGYICRNHFGDIDNLKRGGSDYTASIIGAAIKLEEVQIWTDIDGMHNNDPRVVEKTRPISKLTFDEAAELAYFGAKILHPTLIDHITTPGQVLNAMYGLIQRRTDQFSHSGIKNQKVGLHPFLYVQGSGDQIAIRSAGAYGASMASNYNLRQVEPSVYRK